MSSKETSPLTGLVLLVGFLVLLAFFLDSVAVLGRYAMVSAFGQRSEGRVVGEGSYRTTGRGRRSSLVHVYQYEYRDALGHIHVRMTGQQSFFFGRDTPSSFKPFVNPPPVTVRHLGCSLSWAEVYESDWTTSLIIAAALLLPLFAAGAGTLGVMRGERVPDVSPSPSRPPAPPRKRRMRRRR